MVVDLCGCGERDLGRPRRCCCSVVVMCVATESVLVSACINKLSMRVWRAGISTNQSVVINELEEWEV